MQRPVQALSSDIVIPIGAIFSVDRVSKSLKANEDGIPLVGKFTPEFNNGRDDINSILNTIQGVRHCFFLVDDEKTASIDQNLTPDF